MRRAAQAALAFALTALGARVVAAEPQATPTAAPAPTAVAAAPAAKPPADAAGDLQSPEQVSTRYSAYSLPAHRLGVESGALGVGGGEVVALLRVTYGLGAGLQLNANLAHYGVGLFNAGVGFHFIDTRYFDLGARLGAWYGHGKWFWIAAPAAQELMSKIDLVNVPLELTASSIPTRWLELDLGVGYTYSKIFGTSSREGVVFTDSDLAMQQLFVRPGARFFIAGDTALEFFAKLPLYSAVALERTTPTVPFKRTWTIEGGLRSRLARGLFGSVRLHYGSISDVLYGARLFPSFEVEVRP